MLHWFKALEDYECGSTFEDLIWPRCYGTEMRIMYKTGCRFKIRHSLHAQTRESIFKTSIAFCISHHITIEFKKLLWLAYPIRLLASKLNRQREKQTLWQISGRSYCTTNSSEETSVTQHQNASRTEKHILSDGSCLCSLAVRLWSTKKTKRKVTSLSKVDPLPHFDTSVLISRCRLKCFHTHSHRKLDGKTTPT